MSDASEIPDPADDPPVIEPAPPPAAPEPAPPPAAPEAVVATPPPPPTPAWTPPESQDGGAMPAAVTERPEIAAGAAFAGGLVLALILKRLAR